jgi:CzcA family heavy metal efflux pump
MRWLLGWSLRARGTVVALSVVAMVFGVAQVRHTKLDSLPEFGPPIVKVQTEALGLSAPEVEQLITVPLEQDLLDGVAWLAAIRSQSLPGLSSIQMIFEPGTDLLRARQVVQERISQAAGLPNVSTLPQMLQPESSTSRAMIVGLSSDTVSPIEMSVLTRWTIRPRLLGVPGVANVAIWGQRERQLQVQVDPEELRRFGISLQQVIETTGNALWASPLTFLEANTPGTGGFIDTNNQRLGIQHLQPIRTADDLARVPIEDQQGTTLHLSDVASVVENHQPLIGDAVLTGGSGLLLVIEKTPGANTLDVTDEVEEALDALRPGLTGITVDPTIYRPATYIEMSAHNVAVALLIGLVLLVLALGVFFFDWRTALVSVAVIAMSLIAAGAVLYVRRVTVNAMVLAGLVMALGVVIDDAIIDVERATRRLRDQRMNGHGNGEHAATVIFGALLEMRSSIVYATAVIAATVLPVFFLRGESGAFFPPLAHSFLLAIVASMAVALVVTPALALTLLSGAPRERRRSPVATWLQRGYDRALQRTIGAPRLTYVAVAVVVVAGLAACPFLRGSVLPPINDADVLIHMGAAPGTSLPEMDRLTHRVSEEVQSITGVANVAAHVGRAITSDRVVDVDSSELWVAIDQSADHDATLASIRRVVNGLPGVEARLRTYPNETVTNAFTSANQPIVVRVFGQDLQILNDKAQEIRDAISRIDGVVEPRVQLQVQEPTVDIKVDLAAAEGYGIKPGDVRRAAATLLSGISVGSLFDQQKVFDVVVWGAPEVRESLSSVRNLLIDTPGGGHVRLANVADVNIASTPPVIRHEEIFRSLDVTADVRGRKVGAVLDDVQRRLQDVAFPLEYHAEMVGDYAQRQADWRHFLSIAVAAGIGILLLLQAAFRSWRLATISFFTVPVALAGGALAALIDGRLVSLGSAAGFFTVFAIATRGTITLIRHYQHLERDEGVAPGQWLILRGSQERLVPTVMTALVTGLLLLPLVVSFDVAGQELLHPMAVVILGGLITSTLLTLFVVPVLCARFSPTPGVDIFESPISQPTITVPERPVITLPGVEPAGTASDSVEGK